MYLLPVALLALWATWCAALDSPDDDGVISLDRRASTLIGLNYATFALELLKTPLGDLSGVAVTVTLQQKTLDRLKLWANLRLDTGSPKRYVANNTYDPSLSNDCAAG